MGAQGREQEVEQVDDQNAHGQHPERLRGVVGHHAVVDVHDKERAGHGDEVDDHACQGHMAVNGRVVAQHVPEPALALGQGQLFRALVGRGLHGGKEGIPGIFLLEGGQGHALRAVADFGKDHFRRVPPQSREHAGAVFGKQKNAGQHQGGDVFQHGAEGNAARKPRLARRSQAGLRRHPAAGEPGHQKLRRNRLAPQAQKHGQAAQQAGHEIHIRGAQRPHGLPLGRGLRRVAGVWSIRGSGIRGGRRAGLAGVGSGSLVACGRRDFGFLPGSRGGHARHGGTRPQG